MNDTLDGYLRFLLHTQIIDHETCYLCGYLTAQKEVDESMNPFVETYAEARAWREGWWAGWFNELPAYPLTEADMSCLTAWRANRMVRPSPEVTYTMALALGITMAWLEQATSSSS